MPAPLLKDQWMLCFLAATRSATLAEAAHSLGLTVRTVNRNLKELEQALGTPLFVRPDKARIRLLTEGWAFYEQITPIADALVALETAFLNPPEAPVLRLGWDSVWLPLLLPRWLERAPSAPRQIRRFTAQEAFKAALLAGELDIGISTARLFAPGLEVFAGPPSPYVIVGLPQLQGSWDQLDYLVLESPAGDGWDERRYPRRVRCRADHLHAILDLCFSGLGAAWLPQCLVADALKSHQLAIVATPPQPQTLTPYLIWREQPAQAGLEAVLASFKKALSKKEGLC